MKWEKSPWVEDRKEVWEGNSGPLGPAASFVWTLLLPSLPHGLAWHLHRECDNIHAHQECLMVLTYLLLIMNGCVWNVWDGGGDFGVWFRPAHPGHVFLIWLIDWMAFVRAAAHNPRGMHPAFLKVHWDFGIYH